MPSIEIEFRSRFDEKKYDELKKFLDKNAEDLGKDDKDVHFFILPDRLAKVVDNKSKGTAKIVLKLQKIGKGIDFEEIEVEIKPSKVSDAVKLLKNLRNYDTIMNTFQKRHNYKYKDVEIALKWSDVWGYHLELEILVDNLNKKENAEKSIREVAKGLGISLMTDEELTEFTRNAEKDSKKRNI